MERNDKEWSLPQLKWCIMLIITRAKVFADLNVGHVGKNNQWKRQQEKCQKKSLKCHVFNPAGKRISVAGEN